MLTTALFTVRVMYSTLALLVDILTEPSQGDVISALTTLANVASRSQSHPMVRMIIVVNVCS